MNEQKFVTNHQFFEELDILFQEYFQTELETLNHVPIVVNNKASSFTDLLNLIQDVFEYGKHCGAVENI